MFKISKLLCGLAESLKIGNQFRFQSSKQMFAVSGSIVSKNSRDVCKPTATTTKYRSKKTIGPYRAPRNEECLVNPCCLDPPTLYDEDYKHLLEHKKRRKYQKTWKECPPRRTVQKLACGEPLPEVKCKLEEVKSMVPPKLECPKGNPKCPKITMPGCRKAEYNVLCRKYPHPANCEKIRCPYPAFSECIRDLPKPTRPVECACRRIPGMCEVYRLMKAKGKLNIGKRNAKYC